MNWRPLPSKSDLKHDISVAKKLLKKFQNQWLGCWALETSPEILASLESFTTDEIIDEMGSWRLLQEGPSSDVIGLAFCLSEAKTLKWRDKEYKRENYDWYRWTKD